MGIKVYKWSLLGDGLCFEMVFVQRWPLFRDGHCLEMVFVRDGHCGWEVFVER